MEKTGVEKTGRKRPVGKRPGGKDLAPGWERLTTLVGELFNKKRSLHEDNVLQRLIFTVETVAKNNCRELLFRTYI